MNYTIGIFCKKGNLFLGYPDTSCEEQISRYSNILDNGEMLAVHQEHDLMTYSYIRPIQDGFFGFVFCFNKVATDKIKSLFKICESEIEKLIVDGDIIQFNDSGLIVFNDKLTAINDNVALRTIENLKQIIDKGAQSFYQIDHSSYRLPDNDNTIVNINYLPEKAASLIKRNRTVYFFNAGNANTLLINSYSVKLAGLTEELENYKKLTEELQKKKGAGLMVWKFFTFFLLLVIMAGILFFLYSTNIL